MPFVARHVCLPFLAIGWAGAAADDVPARVDAEVIESLFEVTAQPISVVDPTDRYLLLVHERKLLELDQLAAPAVPVAGRTINPSTHAPHAPLDYFGLTLVDFATGESTPILLPRGATLGFPAWAPDGSRFAFTLTRSAGTELWIGEPAEGRARRLVGGLNASLGPPCNFMPDSRRLLCRRIAHSRSALLDYAAQADRYARTLAELPFTPGQPTILDESLVRSLIESRLELIDAMSGQRHAIGAVAAFESVDPAPSSAFLLVTRATEPYPRVSGVDELNRSVEIWDKTGRLVKRLPASARAPQWHASNPATLVWVERRDGADRVMLQEPPFSAPAVEIFRTGQRFSGLEWVEGADAALIREYSESERTARVWYVDAATPTAPPRLLQSGRVDVAHVGAPVTKMNRWGKAVVAVNGDGFYTRGESAGDSGARPSLIHVNMQTGAAERIWESAATGYEEVVDLLTPDAEVLLTRRQSATQPPNYFIDVSGAPRTQALTDFRHPAPNLRDAVRMRLTYRRADGLELSSDLYLPPDHAAGEPLPLVVWAYPRQVGENDSTITMRTRERFMNHDRAFKLVFLLRGYAVMDSVAMPIVGSSAEANDTFIEQIVANAEAAVAAATNTGLVDGSRLGVAGHSYGAFMVANLLAHSELFDAGVALSGAYNRTLTPFGFQTEHRTLWEAPDTYLAMSPFLFSNQIKAPLLLVHGLQDKNAGTSPLQSTQFYQAIRGNGGKAELLLLPLEGHSYRARESVLRTATAMLDWFDRYL